MARGKKNEKELTIEERLEQALVPAEEQPYSVPENWCWVRLSAISKTISKGTTPSGGKSVYTDNGVSFLRVENINDDGTISHEGIAHISEDTHFHLLKRSILEKGDILISIAGTLAKTGIVRYIDLPLNTNQAIAFVRLLDIGISREYIKCSIDNPITKSELLKKTKVTSIPNLTLEIIGDCPIPLPPLAEQQRIVDRIENLFAKLDEAKEKAQAVVDGFEARKAAILHMAFTGELTELWRIKHSTDQGTWIETTIEKIADVKGGKRVPKGMNLCPENTGHPYIRAGNLKQGTVIDEGMMFVPDNVLSYIKNYTVSAGDVYITNVGACIGDCGVIPNKYDGANLTENAVKITNLKCDNKFLALFLSSNTVQQQIKLLIASATLGKLSIANIKKIEIYLPTLEEQKEIVSMLDDVLSKEQQAKETVEAVLDQIEAMKESILARAFRGELGTNDQREESAREMLKQVLLDDKNDVSASTAVQKRLVIPKSMGENLSTGMERDIVKLLYTADKDDVSLSEIMALSSKKFDLLDTIRALENKKIIRKNGKGNYILMNKR